MEWVGKMKVGDLIKRKWNIDTMGPLPSGYRAGLVVGLRDYRGVNAGWIIVRWMGGHGVGNSMYHPENLEVISESR
tara:strand:- start:31 stop:258 length:228 start_codon:yes stop_codon:yes gene_type:complete